MPFRASTRKWQYAFDTVQFYVVPLQAAMKNAHHDHDEPGFWEKWVEEF